MGTAHIKVDVVEQDTTPIIVTVDSVMEANTTARITLIAADITARITLVLATITITINTIITMMMGIITFNVVISTA